MRRFFAAPALIVAAIASSGCDRQATGQTVAVVNDEEISAPELNAELASANVPENADRQQIMPQLLQQVIDRRLLAQQAIEQGVDKTPEYLTRQRRLNEELLINLWMKRQADAIKIPDQRTIDSFIAENPGMFQQRAMLSLDQIEFDMPANRSGLERLRDDHSLEAVAGSLSAMNIPFTRRSGRLDTGTAPPALLNQINALPPGEPFIVPAGTKAIASVITGREPISASAEQNRNIAAEVIRRQKLQESLQTQLNQLRTQAEIEYQTGYEPPKAPAGEPPAGGGGAVAKKS